MNGHVKNCFPLLCTIAAALSLAAPATAPAQNDVDVLEQAAFRAAVDRVSPSVVCIETVGGLDRVGKVLFGTGPTTGLVVDKDGYIVSSAFNFVNKPSSILVRMPDGSRKPAKQVGRDMNRMLVLLKIDVDAPLPVPEIAQQSEMRVGQWTIAVGRAFPGGEVNTAVGILSAVNRIWGKAIQTDAAVSPNNYGGPLVDIQGRVLGVLVPLSPQAANEMAGVEWYDSGIGFAVPVEHVMKILPRLKKGDDLEPGLLGIGFKERALHIADPVVGSCRPNSPAAKAGLKAGDRFVEVNGVPVARAAQVKEQISRLYAGDKVHVVVMRDKQRHEFDIDLIAKLEPYQRPFLGILPMRTGAGEHPPGAVVRHVYPDSPAAKAGIEPVDLITALDGKAVKDANELRDVIAALEPGDEVEVELQRVGKAKKVKLSLGELPEPVPAGPLPPARLAGKPSEGQRPAVGTVKLKIPEFSNDAWAYVPEAYDPAVPHGVLLWLHGESGMDETKVIARWKPFCDAHDLILLAPKAGDPKAWKPTEIALVQKLLEEIRTTYTVDPTRTVACGYQSGGTLGLRVAAADRDLLHAVVAVEAPLRGAQLENDPEHLLAFYVARAEKSDHAEAIDAAVEQLRTLKFPVTVKDLGEKPRELKPEEVTELVRWIDSLDRI